MRYTTITLQGHLLSEEILQKIESGDAPGQAPEHFGLDKGSSIREEIDRAWSHIRLDWPHFRERMAKIPDSDTHGLRISMRWMERFLNAMGITLNRQRSNLAGENEKTYPISHTAGDYDHFPVHVAGFTTPDRGDKNTLDIKTREGARYSPHGLIQEYLNVTEHVYGIVTNGLFLRLIRDSGRLIKLTYVEFDIKRMLDEEKYSEFALMYRLLHGSRFPHSREEIQGSWLEQYHEKSIEAGNRIRDDLSIAVKLSLEALGKGFLRYQENEALRDAIRTGKLNARDYYRELMRVVYRLLFLLVTEERNLIYDPEEAAPEIHHRKKIYDQYYSISRLRKLARHRYLYESQYTDLWTGLLNTFRLFDIGTTGTRLGIQPLGGELFNLDLIRHLKEAMISNELLLECIRNLSEFRDPSGDLVQINYRSLDVEELGSVYESLLDLHPVIRHADATEPGQISFLFVEGQERKTTGSYYTRPELVNELVKSALIPVIEERLKGVKTKDDQIKTLLQLKVCDPAAGSGHMMLAAARTIAWYLARIESGEDNPAPSVYRKCLREVIQHCIYAVDMNPDAVELCKLAFWLEGHNSGKPLSFLDHKIRCGNSLVGVTDLQVLSEPIPDDAYKPVTGDDTAVCRELKRRNAQFRRTRQTDLFMSMGQSIRKDTNTASATLKEMEWISQDTLEGVEAVRKRYEQVKSGSYHDEIACHIWTAAFFKTYEELDDVRNPTSDKLAHYFTSPSQFGQLVGEVTSLAYQHHFFHWPLEFPDVYAQGGFDVMMGNPPWERIKLQQEEFFSTRDSAIAEASNAAARNRLINKLESANPALYKEYMIALHGADATGKFLRSSGRYELTAIGDINTYSVFSELFSTRISPTGRAGFIVPTGIATDDSNKKYFSSLVEGNQLISLFDFENRKAIFQSVHRSYKFCLITLSGSNIGNRRAQFGFFLTEIDHLQDPMRIFSLSREDFLRLNPNTKTCPIFRTRVDAELTSKIYQRVPVLINEETGENPWGVKFSTMFHMSNDSHLFRTREQLEAEGFTLWGNRMRRGEEVWLPLYEAKMIWHYDHRFGTYAGVNSRQSTQTPTPTLIEHQDQGFEITPWYWVSKETVEESIPATWIHNWMMGWRDFTNVTNERTVISCVSPRFGYGDTWLLMFPTVGSSAKKICLIADQNSIVHDFIARQKVGGLHLKYHYKKQLTNLPPDSYSHQLTTMVCNRLLELLYTSYEMKPLADDIWKESNQDHQEMIRAQHKSNASATGGHQWDPPDWCEIDPEGCPLPPFKWDDDRRAVLKAELDAIYAHLYGLTTEELRYILDPQDVYGEDFPGETFRVLKEKEIGQYGEYRTKRLVLEAWERMGYGN